ncbi:hypothetical protein [Haloarchaeobius sp. DT45]|uniref:hypothetical protein n=1 Tax=Haloarchaeobius sp. DT45 TaxID=3446116 RepID=UPI003F6CB7E7
MAQQYSSTTLAALAAALASDGGDELRVTAPAALPVDVTDQAGRDLGKLRLMDSGGTLFDPATEATLQALAAALSSDGGDSLLVDSNGPLDASAATIDVQENTPLDVSGATVDVDLSAVSAGALDASAATIDVQEATPLDVSGATVDVDLSAASAGALDVSAATVETAETALPGLTTGQDSTSGADTPVALNGGTSLSVPAGATLRVKALTGNGGPVYVGPTGVTTGDGYELASGESTSLGVDDVSTVHIVDDTGGYGVSWVVEQ